MWNPVLNLLSFQLEFSVSIIMSFHSVNVFIYCINCIKYPFLYCFYMSLDPRWRCRVSARCIWRCSWPRTLMKHTDFIVTRLSFICCCCFLLWLYRCGTTKVHYPFPKMCSTLLLWDYESQKQLTRAGCWLLLGDCWSGLIKISISCSTWPTYRSVGPLFLIYKTAGLCLPEVPTNTTLRAWMNEPVYEPHPPEVTWHAAQWRIRPSCPEQAEIRRCWRKHCGRTPPCYSEPAACGQEDSTAWETDRQVDRWEVNSADQRRGRGGASDPPDGAVVAPGDGDRLLGVQVERPQLALAVTLHQQNRFVPFSDHYLEDLAVLGPRQDPVGLPANAADRQTWKANHTGHVSESSIVKYLLLYVRPSARWFVLQVTEQSFMLWWRSST